MKRLMVLTMLLACMAIVAGCTTGGLYGRPINPTDQTDVSALKGRVSAVETRAGAALPAATWTAISNAVIVGSAAGSAALPAATWAGVSNSVIHAGAALTNAVASYTLIFDVAGGTNNATNVYNAAGALISHTP